jgi:alpha-galactosidase
VGALPRHLAALIQTNVNVQGLTVESALIGRRAPAYHAAGLDPHTVPELPLDEIAALVNALLDAHAAGSRRRLADRLGVAISPGVRRLAHRG